VAVVSKIVQKLERETYIHRRRNNTQNNRVKMAELIDMTAYCTERAA
jgi:DNA-binding MarR family transcriptional regulator